MLLKGQSPTKATGFDPTTGQKKQMVLTRMMGTEYNSVAMDSTPESEYEVIFTSFHFLTHS